jgi:hypothetical protein
VRKGKAMTLYVGDRVGITGHKSVTHFGEIKQGEIVEIAEWNGKAPVYGKPKLTPTGQFKKAYMVKFDDGTGYIGAYESDELTELS